MFISQDLSPRAPVPGFYKLRTAKIDITLPVYLSIQLLQQSAVALLFAALNQDFRYTNTLNIQVYIIIIIKNNTNYIT